MVHTSVQSASRQPQARARHTSPARRGSIVRGSLERAGRKVWRAFFHATATGGLPRERKRHGAVAETWPKISAMRPQDLLPESQAVSSPAQLPCGAPRCVARVWQQGARFHRSMRLFSSVVHDGCGEKGVRPRQFAPVRAWWPVSPRRGLGCSLLRESHRLSRC